MAKEESPRYKEAGVDIAKGNAFIDNIKPIVASTFRPGVLTGIGGFGGLFALGGGKFKDPVLVSSTDGVGTKLMIANMCNKHDTIGIDLVAMCVNDIIVCGGTPLFFLDYFATGGLDLGVATDVVKGIAKGCEISQCSLIGGETAEMPGLYKAGDYDIAGFVVGICERDKMIDGSEIRVGDKLIGLASNGVHSNGYSLVRKVIFEEMGLTVDDYVEELGCTVGEELLRPTRIYVQPLLNLMKNYKVKGLVHITGGGIIENIPRVLPKGCKAVIDKKSWDVPPIFDLLQKNGNISPSEMCITFNCGIGMVVVVNDKDADDCMQQLSALGETPFLIGEIAARKKKDSCAVEVDCG
ncbi:MAG: phosphoribosylformylglycinamidine cyclo-ligase [Desulfobulbaceae bacterium]|nr:phosphoribosylformylglycinamidine cyclo-ligase [Desulfobulbaceae bacterium]HIJ79086.1 phosphoribosylformylglycinamidine cyclo-ligase [Deltaproteobacteria bacterium]